MRFFAALLVFLIHLMQPLDPVAPEGPINPFADEGLTASLLRLFGPAGYLGVSFFFLLSGFVLTWAWRPGEALGAFWRRRFVKIFPSHLAVWGAIMLLFGSSIPLITWLPNLLLVNSFVNIPAVQLGVNAPSWSLCAELLFYALFPLLIVGVRKISESRLWWWAAGMLAGMAMVTLITLYIIPDTPKSPLIPLSFPQMWFNYTFPVTRMFEFVLGMLLARLVLAGRWPRVGVGPVLALLALGYIGAMYIPQPFNFSLVMAIPFSVLICAGASADIRGVTGFLGNRWMIWLGKVSFGFYLVQGFTLFYGRPAVLGTERYSTPTAILVAIALFAVTLLAGWLLHIGVEEPAMRYFARSRKADRTRGVAVEPAPVEALPAVVPEARAS
ncbi:acyltransferase family protein [Micromonospora sp. DT31]|uniref:acyltransferase family protein n=1 Tax=Micromonospora sp. DT31 TaxID=3393434 RepID=UPI003CEE6FF1